MRIGSEKFAKRSPGKVLLYLMLERLFKEGGFQLLDFDGSAYYPYTEFFSTRSDISSYYAVYVDWSRRKRIPFVEEDEFQAMFSLTQNRRLFLARHEGQVIAGAVLRFCYGGVAEYAANSSLERALQFHPNHLLQWRAIEWACAEGMTRYSLGGAHFFLRKFGGHIVPTTRCRLDLSLFRRVAFADWIADQAERARPLIPGRLVTAARSLKGLVEKPRNPGASDDLAPIPKGRA